MDKQDSVKISIAGKNVPVYFKDQNGIIVVPSEVERDIVLGFIGRALATPVTAIVIVLGSGFREIRLTYQLLAEAIHTELYEIQVQGEVERMNAVMRAFGPKIDEIMNSNYPQEVKQEGKRKMLEAMNKRLSEFSN
ncbi:hypothetical protein [Aerosakkonema funiforme]|uniref:Uncharacterized protein n=1 Tax=Aerosakkonema funiforme FACHB-1375 TaxID=2949571 RepID=A0A926ZIN3_9CYAN|nr:hypothetical protein [Aerosakkonema funiforme]MBD2184235.1 hypothetical protein [Aerosakkonema funiforme FACHB-1375]